MTVRALYEITWIESESGWGQSIYGVSVYPTKQHADQAIAKHWAMERERNPSGQTPSYYIRPGTPKLVEVNDDKVYERAHQFGEAWIS